MLEKMDRIINQMKKMSPEELNKFFHDGDERIKNFIPRDNDEDRCFFIIGEDLLCDDEIITLNYDMDILCNSDTISIINTLKLDTENSFLPFAA